MNSGLKNGTKVTWNLLSNVIDYSTRETNFPHKLLLTDAQVSRICEAFAHDSSNNVKLSKNQLSKIGQSAGFLVRIIWLLPKTGLPLCKMYLHQYLKAF